MCDVAIWGKFSKADLSRVWSDMFDAARPAMHQALMPVPVTQFQHFIFPGSKVFAYKKVNFSNNQDLVTDLTYAAPRRL